MKSRSYGLTLAACTILLIILFLVSLFYGAVSLPPAEVARLLLHFGDDAADETLRFIVLSSRLPQAIAAILCGVSLSVSGLLLQTVFRNPLAGPGVLGITSGASLGVAVVMLCLGGSVATEMIHLDGFLAILFAAFAGAAVCTAILLAVATVVRRTSMLLLVGLMMGYLASSLVSLFNFSAMESGVHSFTLWGMGSFVGVSMAQVPYFVIIVIIGVVAAVMSVKPLNALLIGESYASGLGVDTRMLRYRLLAITSLLTGVATAFCGPIAFIGLAVPHAARLLMKTENQQRLLPTTIILGALTMLGCHLLCSLPMGEGLALPINAVTPFFGAPFIIYIILRDSRKQ